jgi:alanine dehydrogenase
MRIGIPTEIKPSEYRVAITPTGVAALVEQGHAVCVQSGAGIGSNITDAQYEAAGASILETAEQVWSSSELALKVKEPLPAEYPFFRPGLTLFTYLHLAAQPALTQALLHSGITAFAYETVQLANRRLPLLAPMSEVAGRLSVVVGANALLKPNGGSGMLISGVTGTAPAHVVVLGAGVAGSSAISMAVGLGARVSVLDTNEQRLSELNTEYPGALTTVVSNASSIEAACVDAELVIGSVLVPGAKAPKLVTNALVAKMKPGSVLVDIAVDQGGCFEDTRPTTHDSPTFEVHGSLFYCVANMPGAVPQTSTEALTHATLPYVQALATGWASAVTTDSALHAGLNITAGQLVNEAVGQALGIPWSRYTP